MAIEMHALRSRRSLLVAVGASVAGAFAATVTGAQRVLAAGDDGKVIHVGNAFLDVRSGTYLQNKSTIDTVFEANCANGIGLLGRSGKSYGVAGVSYHNAGVAGIGIDTTGVHGEGTIGVEGSSAESYFWGVGGYNTAAHGYGVWGEADHATGVAIGGSSTNGRGAVFQGGKAPLRLTPSANLTHPTTGAAGDLFVDAGHRLWFCKQGGSPAVWKQVALV
jgi:hypothetical protein